MTREEMIEKMSEAGIGKSKLHMRSENLQTSNRVHRIPRLKKAVKKKSKLLVLTEIALPFNPETGKEDDMFNPDCKYRPTYCATTTALILKGMANSNATLKETLMKKAGVTEWNTEDFETFTKDDWKIFAKYRVPRVFSIPVVHINIPAMTKSEYGRDYAISVKFDDNGDVVGEMPGVLKVNKLFRDKIYEELQDYQAKLDSGELKRTEQDQRDDRTAIRRKNPVSDVHPANYAIAIELPLTNVYTLAGSIDYNDTSEDTVKSQSVLLKYSTDIKDAIEQYVSGAYAKFDKYFDYFMIDMGCPVSGDDQSPQGRADIGRNTKFDKPTNLFDDEGMLTDEQYTKFAKVLQDYVDGWSDVEEQVRRSIFTPQYDETVENQMFITLQTVLDIKNDPFVTKRVLTENREVISLAFAGVGVDLLDEIDAGISEKSDGNLDSAEAAAEAKKYDLESEDFADDDVPLDSVVAE